MVKKFVQREGNIATFLSVLSFNYVHILNIMTYEEFF